MIGLIDYGAGNLLSVKKALEYLKVDCRIITNSDEVDSIDRMILPGVGAFEASVKRLTSSGLFEPIKKWINEDKSFLGICLGMQLLMDHSEESSPEIKGFQFLKGNVAKFQGHKVPQIGWNQVKISKPSKLFTNLKDDSFFYFVHSYYVNPDLNGYTIGVTHYTLPFTSAVQKGNVYGVQFHPEKSGDNGLKLLKNWIELC
jgi:imidazole glycerol-phosphate synthase subunit HisH